MVESGMIDKYTHLLDMERAVYDTIMLDNAVKLARDWAARVATTRSSWCSPITTIRSA